MEKHNFQGRTILATAVDDPDNLNMIRYSKDSQGNYYFSGGYSTKIILELQFLLNFTLKATMSDSYISEEEYTLGGIGQQLINGSADIAIPLSYLLPFRAKYITPLLPLVREPMLAVFRQPGSTSVRDIYLGTLSNSVWIALICVLLLISISFTLGFYLHSNSSDVLMDAGEGLVIVAAVITDHSWYNRARSYTSKIQIFICFIFGYTTVEFFRATIISKLSFEIPAIQSFDDLLNKFNYKILTNPIQQWGKFIYPEEDGHKLENFLKDLAINYKGLSDSVIKTLTIGGYALLTTLDEFIPAARDLNYTDPELCTIVSFVTLKNLNTDSGFFIAKNSNLQEPFNLGITLILERGLHIRHYRQLLQHTTLKCLANDFEKPAQPTKPLEFGDVSTAFAIICIALLSGFIGLCFESIYHKFDLNTYRKQ